MDDIWFWLILAFVVGLYATVEYLFFDGVMRTGVNAFVWSAEKLKILRPDRNQIDSKELNQLPHNKKKKSRDSKKSI
jgi:hypothetical protein